jgi:Tfp pilus assembly protein FimT
LVELVAVMLLMGIMASLAVPALSRAGEQRSAAAVEAVARDINYARDSAAASGVGTWVVFSTTSNNYTLYGESRSSPGRAGRSVMTDPATGASFVQALNSGDFAGASLSSVSIGGGAEVGFDWLGRPKSASEVLLSGDGTIAFTNGRSITINAQSGSATAQ